MKALSLTRFSFCFIILISFACNNSSKTNEVLEAQTINKKPTCPSASEVISLWPEAPSVVAKQMIDKYGEPDGVTPTELIWENNGKWKRSVVFRDEVMHNFPDPHKEFLQQTIDYKLPIDKFEEIVAFNGSIIIDRTKGELSVLGIEEPSNVLAINIANEVATDKRDVMNARSFYVKTLLDEVNKDKNPYLQRFLFSVPHGNSGDPDMPVDLEKNEANNDL